MLEDGFQPVTPILRLIMSDPFQTLQPHLTSPANNAFSITPSDVADLPFVTRAVYFGGSGDLRILTAAGEDVTFLFVPQGVILPVRAKKVFASGTTATSLMGMY